MFVGLPREPSWIPTDTASTNVAPRSRAAFVGTGATSAPSARERVPISTGSNSPGKAQLARIASIRLPSVSDTGSPVLRSVAPTASGICSSSNCRDSKTFSIKSPRRWLLAKPNRETRHPAMSRKRSVRHVAMMRASGAPLAYAAPRMLPTLVPAIQEIGMLCCSSTCSTPRCANPRAKPPPNARPIPGRAAGVARSNGPGWWLCVTPRECQRPHRQPMGRASRKNSTDVLRVLSAQKSTNFRSSTFLLPFCPLCTIGLRSTARDSLPRQDAPHGGGMHSAFAMWIGQHVVLQVALGKIKVPLRGKLLKEGGDTLRMRIGDGWDVDIYKTMVLAVEEDAMATVAA